MLFCLSCLDILKKRTCQSFSQVPVIDNRPIVFNLFEGTVKNTELGCITCTPTTPGQPYDIKIQDVSPAIPCGSRCFGLWNKNPAPTLDFCMYFISSQGAPLSYQATQKYSITIVCRDDTADIATTIVDIQLIPNQPPRFPSPFDRGDISNTKSLTAGSTILLANAQDADVTSNNDVLSYFMAATPDQGLFEIGQTDGQIRLKQDTRQVCSITSPTILDITVRDNANAVDTKKTELHLADVPEVPSITNINKIIFVSESTPILTAIQTLTPSTTVSYNYEATPSTYTGYFIISANVLELSKQLNFEEETFINLTIYTHDGFCVGSNWLGISVNNVNDPPTLSTATTIFVENEGMVNFDPGFVAVDEDRGDRLIYSFLAASNVFAINPNTGRISSLGNLDLDILNIQSRDYILDVQVSDGVASSVSQIRVTIKDINDNRPVIVGASGYSYLRMDCNETELLGTMVAFDNDRGTNGMFGFTGGNSGPLTVTKDGRIFMVANPPTGGYFVQVSAVDHGTDPGPLTSTTQATVSLVVLPCPVPTTEFTTEVTTPLFTGKTTPILPIPDGQMNFFHRPENIPWLIAAGILGLLLLLLVFYVIYRLCCARELPPFPKRAVTTPPPARNLSKAKRRGGQKRTLSTQRKGQKNGDREVSTEKKKNKQQNGENSEKLNSERPRPSNQPDQPSRSRVINHFPDAPPRAPLANPPPRPSDDNRTMTPYKLDNEPISNDLYKPRTDNNPYEFWRGSSDDNIVSSRQIKVSPKN
ncbi:hypothetical protein SNE40_021547 [Patella caerulea]|uniref:Cadherin domain-containing protein n=1 Tax=Patella caerulea TaxID=87958 RepID=A0AAN8G833_PATCE